MQKTKQNVIDVSERKTVTTEGLQDLLGCGAKTAKEIGEAAGARIQVGRRVLWNVSKVQEYIDMVSGV